MKRLGQTNTARKMSSPTDGKAEIKAMLDVKTQCIVVGSDECVNTLFGALATLGTVTISSDSRVITVTRRALDGADEEEEPKALPYNHQAFKECTALRVVDKVKDEQKQLEAKIFGVSIEDECVFYRRNKGDVNISAA
ncbi:hypothetical protein Pelo_19090 [Pelomyxa schiedti]|nr:hypothetical protein Pelo_19090 [Pelomyxa schiedti]